MVEQRRAEEIALLIPLKAESAAVDHQLGAFIHAHLDMILDARLVLRAHHRAVFRLWVGRDPDPQPRYGFHQTVAQISSRLFPDRNHARNRHAALAPRTHGPETGRASSRE